MISQFNFSALKLWETQVQIHIFFSDSVIQWFSDSVIQWSSDPVIQWSSETKGATITCVVLAISLYETKFLSEEALGDKAVYNGLKEIKGQG